MSDIYNITNLSGGADSNAVAYRTHLLLVDCGDRIWLCYGKEDTPLVNSTGVLGNGIHMSKEVGIALLGVLQKLYPLDALSRL